MRTVRSYLITANNNIYYYVNVDKLMITSGRNDFLLLSLWPEILDSKCKSKNHKHCVELIISKEDFIKAIRNENTRS